MQFLEYKGTLLNPNDMENGPVKDAYISYREQRTRCYNKNRKKYKNYGAKGIEVKYTSRQFIGWWLSEIKYFKGKKPTIGRINHDGNYEFGNIIIQDISDNSIERNKRVPSFLKPKKVICTNNNIKLEFESINRAAKYFNVNSIFLYNLIKNKKIFKGYSFGNYL